MRYDLIIIGAGFSGATFARKAAETGKKILLLEQRDHIGGNCFDYQDDNGIIIHPYGPHLFHTDNTEVIDFLSRFTEWTPYHHKVRVHIGEQNVPLPINFTSLEMLFAQSDALKETLFETFKDKKSVSIFELLESDNEAIRTLGDYVYENVFVNYTVKQWGTTPDAIDRSVLRRVPVRLNFEDGYFDDGFQQMPTEGFTPLFKAMLSHENITLNLGVNALERLHVSDAGITFDGAPFDGTVVYTGMLDALYAHCYGHLPYRSQHFEFETLEQEWFQEVTVVNYPAAPDMTRITEFKHIYQSASPKTVIAREFPQAYEKGKNLPYYPLFTDDSKSAYERYAALSQATQKLIVIGRLAEYRYYDMDDAVANALEAFKRYQLQ